MTTQKAAEILKREYLGDSELMELAKHMGVKALEKQIPQKPNVTEMPCKNLYSCPSCHHRLFAIKNFCDNCGQALERI